MDVRGIKTVCVISVLLIGFFTAGCGEPVGTDKGALLSEADLGPTIGSLVEVFSLEPILVEGYGVVAGLNGTGSAECPPQIRTYLEQYILRQLPELKIDVEKFISGLNTAVVLVHGLLPATASKNQSFDIRVAALPGTQTTSLEGGWLYDAELKTAGGFGITTKVLATAKGPVFTDTISTSGTDKKVGYILGGGMVLDDYRIGLALRRPDYKTAGLIRNRLNARWDETARAIGPGRIELKVPAKYRGDKQRFVSIVKSMYLSETREITRERIKTFVRRLAVSDEKEQSEIALEAIGKESLSKVGALLKSSNEEVRLRAGRCMLNLGDESGLEALRETAMNKGSSYRVEALETIGRAARRNDATAISRRLLRDEDFTIRLAAYEQLRRLDDIAVTRTLIARNFYLEEIAQTEYRTIFASRSGQQRILLFGAPLSCRRNIFVQSSDGNITINSPSGQKYVSIMRKHPKRPSVIVQLKSTFELSDIIQTLCEEPLKKAEEERLGLGVSYPDVIGLLKQMCDKGAVNAEFRAGPLPKID